MTSFYLDTDGEVFALWTDDAGFPQVQVLESWRIDKPTVADDRIFDGVQLDTQGRVLGYWLDGETFLDANALVYLFDLERYTQYRGMSPIRRGANEMRDAGDIKGFQKVLSKLSTVLTLAIQGAPLEENPWGSPPEPAGEASTKEETSAETNEKQRTPSVNTFYFAKLNVGKHILCFSPFLFAQINAHLVPRAPLFIHDSDSSCVRPSEHLHQISFVEGASVDSYTDTPHDSKKDSRNRGADKRTNRYQHVHLRPVRVSLDSER